jgi:hypothetical protein
MSLIILFIDPAELSYQPTEETSPYADLTAKPAQQASIVAVEERLWKLGQSAVSSKLAIVELGFLLLVLALALVVIIGCFTELYYLLQNDAVGHVAGKAIGAN